MAAHEDFARPTEPPKDPTHDNAEADRVSLFNAVRSRLRDTVNGPLDAANAPVSPQAMSRVREAVLECDSALGQLQDMLEAEGGRQLDLESQVAESRRALSLTQERLAAAQAEEKRERYLASHDELTSLPNRRCFGERLEAAMVRARVQHHALALFYLDLDDFKAVNDLHGHVVGDELLRIVAMRLSRAVRTDDVIARIGGDEFACLLVGMPGRAQLVQLACKLFDVVSAPLRVGTVAIAVRPSIGISVWSPLVTSATALVEQADAAMYHAKQQRSGYAFAEGGLAPATDPAMQTTSTPAPRSNSI